CGAAPWREAAMPRKRIVSILLVASALCGPACAPFPAATAANAYRHRQYETALGLYRPLADQGNAVAQYTLGLMYANGQGVPQDYGEAAKWFRLAAEQGEATAQFNLGVLYHSGRGVSQNDAEALKWYRRAADQGHASAQGNLGFMYSIGQGVPQDY